LYFDFASSLCIQEMLFMKLNFSHVLSSLMLGLVPFILTGCGNDQALVPVSGSVFLDSRPLANATVIFHPADGRPSVGKTDEMGDFELSYIREEKGALIGKHSVSISTYQEADPDSENETIRQGAPEVVPSRYNARTTLTAEVVPGDTARFDFLLDSDERSDVAQNNTSR
jgi:hypothetical protein